jgi:hypothetical protein
VSVAILLVRSGELRRTRSPIPNFWTEIEHGQITTVTLGRQDCHRRLPDGQHDDEPLYEFPAGIGPISMIARDPAVPPGVCEVAAKVFATLDTGRQIAPFSSCLPAFGLADAYHVTFAVRQMREARGRLLDVDMATKAAGSGGPEV